MAAFLVSLTALAAGGAGVWLGWSPWVSLPMLAVGSPAAALFVSWIVGLITGIGRR